MRRRLLVFALCAALLVGGGVSLAQITLTMPAPIGPPPVMAVAYALTIAYAGSQIVYKWLFGDDGNGGTTITVGPDPDSPPSYATNDSQSRFDALPLPLPPDLTSLQGATDDLTPVGDTVPHLDAFDVPLNMVQTWVTGDSQRPYAAFTGPIRDANGQILIEHYNAPSVYHYDTGYGGIVTPLQYQRDVYGSWSIPWSTDIDLAEKAAVFWHASNEIFDMDWARYLPTQAWNDPTDPTNPVFAYGPELNLIAANMPTVSSYPSVEIMSKAGDPWTDPIGWNGSYSEVVSNGILTNQAGGLAGQRSVGYLTVGYLDPAVCTDTDPPCSAGYDAQVYYKYFLVPSQLALYPDAGSACGLSSGYVYSYYLMRVAHTFTGQLDSSGMRIYSSSLESRGALVVADFPALRTGPDGKLASYQWTGANWLANDAAAVMLSNAYARWYAAEVAAVCAGVTVPDMTINLGGGGGVMPWDATDAPDYGTAARATDSSPVLWLVNPLAALQAAFIPTVSLADHFSDLWANLKTKFPFALATTIAVPVGTVGGAAVGFPPIVIGDLTIAQDDAWVQNLCGVIRVACMVAAAYWLQRWVRGKLTPRTVV